MTRVFVAELPAGALLGRYAPPVAYTDCYVADVSGAVSHADFVRAFYTSPAFRLERLLLGWLAGRPSTDGEAAELAAGSRDAFAVWQVEARAPGQILLAAGRTRSWLMVVAGPPSAAPGTRLYFGSAVVPRRDTSSGRASMGLVFRLLLGFHRLYSRVLLAAAATRAGR